MKKKCHSLKEVRKNIDRIDRKLVPLIGEREFYVKESLKFKYKKKEIADKCKEWCKEHKSCNIAITKYAIK